MKNYALFIFVLSGVVFFGAISTVQSQGGDCFYTLAATNRTHGYGAASGVVSLDATSGCPWEVVNTNSWIHILSNTNGVGSGTISYAMEANYTDQMRTAVVLIASERLTLEQRGMVCTNRISPMTRQHGWGAMSGVVDVITCSSVSWTVVNTNSWITITSATNGMGPGIVSYVLASNYSELSRDAVLVIADQLYAIKQLDAPCYSETYAVYCRGPYWDDSSIFYVYHYDRCWELEFQEQATNNFVDLSTGAWCSWLVINTNSWIRFTPSNGVGNSTILYSVEANPSEQARTGVVQMGTQTLLLTQQGIICTNIISPATRQHGYDSTAGTVNINTTCSTTTWTVENTNTWISILSPPNGVGSGTINYSLACNSGRTRAGVLLIAGQPFTVNQSGMGRSSLGSVRLLDAGLEFVLQGERGATYVIEVSTDMITWEFLSTGVNSSGTMLVEDPGVPLAPCRFYRTRMAE